MKNFISPILMLMLALLIIGLCQAEAQTLANPCYTSFVVSYTPGVTKGGDELTLLEDYSSVLGSEEGSESYISLGIGGEIILGFDNPVPVGTGMDLLIDERDDNAAPERVDVYVSLELDDASFVRVGENIPQNGQVDVTGFTEIKYVKLVDVSDPDELSGDNANGYDLDRLVALHGCGTACAIKPNAELISDITQCPDGNSTLEVSLSGIGPWNLGYTNGAELQTVENIEDANISLPLNMEGKVRLAWVTDKASNCTQIIEESNTTFIANPTRAYFQDNLPDTICLMGTGEWVRVVLFGKAPWTITYSVTSGEEVEVLTEKANKSEYKGEEKVVHQFKVSKLGQYKLLSVEDACMTGEIEGKDINLVALSTAQFLDPDTVCNSAEDASLKVELTGAAPWQLTWEVEGVEYSQADISNPLFTIPLDLSGQYILKSVQGAADCEGAILEDSIVSVISIPTAQIIKKSGELCNPSEEVALAVSLTGQAPFTFAYTLDGIPVDTIKTHLDEYEIPVSKAGTYQLAWVENACGQGTISGEVELDPQQPTFNKISYEIVAQSCNKAILLLKADSVSDDFQYQWYSGNQPIGQEGTVQFSAAIGGNLNISLVTTQGLCSDTTERTIPVESFGSGNLGRFQWSAEGELSCEGQSLVFNSDSTNTSFTYQWKVDGVVAGEDANFSSQLSAGLHSVQLVVNDDDCLYSSQQKIEIPEYTPEELASFSYSLAEAAQCDAQTVDFSADSVNVAFTYRWTVNGTEVSQQAGFSYDLATGDSEIALEIMKGGCAYSSTQTIVFEGVSLPNTGEFEYGTETLNCGVWSLSATALDLGEELQYQWWLDDELIGEQERLSIEIAPGEHILRLRTVVGGCHYEVEKTVSVPRAESLVNVPNVLSPQAIHPDDQVVKVFGNCIASEEFYFQIIDRWGGIAYETKSAEEAINRGWDGGDQSGGIYTYVLRGQFDSGTPFQKQGTITLLK